jgi:hypothetical protein
VPLNPFRKKEFPDVTKFSKGPVGPYERQMGANIAALVQLFQSRVPDSETSSQVLALAKATGNWSAGHAVFDCVRIRLLAADESKDELRQAQYHFEESCLKAIYNATDPKDPFDPSSAYWIASEAIRLARLTSVPIEDVLRILAPEKFRP